MKPSNKVRRLFRQEPFHMQAAEALRRKKEKIKSLWEQKSREQISQAAGMTSPVMVNSLGIFIDELIAILERSDGAVEVSAKEGMTQIHGSQRASATGYFLPQLLKEFSILHEVINNELHDENLLSFEIRGIIDRVMVEAASLAAEEFAKVQGEKVQTALEKAQSSNRDLEHFASVAAHDLKSPLATISGYLDLLAEQAGDRLDGEHRNYLRIIEETAERMRSLIDRLLEYATLSGDGKKFGAVESEDALTAALDNLHETIETTGARVTYDSLPAVNGDLNLLTQLFQNLIANSIKFRSNETPRIHVSATDSKDQWLFSVSDNGIGFNPEHKETIFALFKQLPSEKMQSGTGIGLASCRKVVELHGGKIWADSEPGKGSTFSFTLPKVSIDEA